MSDTTDGSHSGPGEGSRKEAGKEADKETGKAQAETRRGTGAEGAGKGPEQGIGRDALADCDRTARELIEEVGLLVSYGLQQGDLPDDLDIARLHGIKAKLDDCEAKPLTSAEFAAIVADYKRLTRRYPEVSPRTLAATQPDAHGRMRKNETAEYLRCLWYWTLGLVLFAVSTNVAMHAVEVNLPHPGQGFGYDDVVYDLWYQALRYIEPFLYGALGAFAYVLRVTADKLYKREFDPTRIGEHVNRIVLGTLAGGSIILFITQIPNEDTSTVQLSAAALGFLSGYSVDFLFNTLDRIINAVLPRVSLGSSKRSVQRTRDEDLIKECRSLLETASDEESRARLKLMIEALEAR
mgnify:CR=1 FL=1